MLGLLVLADDRGEVNTQRTQLCEKVEDWNERIRRRIEHDRACGIDREFESCFLEDRFCDWEAVPISRKSEQGAADLMPLHHLREQESLQGFLRQADSCLPRPFLQAIPP